MRVLKCAFFVVVVASLVLVGWAIWGFINCWGYPWASSLLPLFGTIACDSSLLGLGLHP